MRLCSSRNTTAYGRIAIHHFRAHQFFCAQRVEAERNRERPLQMAVQHGESLDIPGLVSSNFPPAVERDARLDGLRQTGLPDHPKAGIYLLFVPVVVGMPVLIALADYQAVVNDGLMRMRNEILHSGINRSGVREILPDALHVRN